MQAKLISSLEKVFPEQAVRSFRTLSSLSVLYGERFSFQIVYRADKDESPVSWIRVGMQSDTEARVSFRIVDLVPVLFPCYEGKTDDLYLKKTPGLYPDLLSPTQYDSCVPAFTNQTRAVWVTVEGISPSEATPGNHTLHLTLSKKDGRPLAELTLSLRVVPVQLPKPNLYFTQWFYCDCLATQYHTTAFSERHWEIIESFLRCAARNGINTILTPLFTPPLDTEIGGERLSTQLVDITLESDGSYRFKFDKLDRWVDLCQACGIENFEMAHLFTQWGAKAAPKVVAQVNGIPTRIFGWDTPSKAGEYPHFLSCFLPELVDHLKRRGLEKNVFFHISDEPTLDFLETYRSLLSIVKPYLEGFPIMDAMSDLDFYKQGLCNTPVPGNDHIEPFLEEGVENLWTYYCCVQGRNVSNRFIAMPSARNRCLGYQLYKYNIKGFLHWGFNFYNNMNSHDIIFPFLNASGSYQVPDGDAFQVYPAPDGTPLESIRLVVFHEGLQDLAALQLCEAGLNHEEVVKELESVTGPVSFSSCPDRGEPILRMRRAINRLIEKQHPAN
ncbi:MAG: DUF4091 domain-containing protein [Clostridia bacterium]|nr:DUF4091 domain-containing protein [Clostridia bacterium]